MSNRRVYGGFVNTALNTRSLDGLLESADTGRQEALPMVMVVLPFGHGMVSYVMLDSSIVLCPKAAKAGTGVLTLSEMAAAAAATPRNTVPTPS